MNLLAVVEYDGTDLLGFQTQKRGRTVQGELEKALAEFGDKRIRVTGGGRTDAGVHAAGQTASFTIDWTRDLETLKRALNNKLPADISVRSLREVPPGFSARYSAVARVYEYRIYNAPERSALTGRYALWVPAPLSAEAMTAAAGQLIGRKDFGAFGTPPRGTNTVRELREVRVWREGQFVTCRLEANAFLYRMVRRLVGALLEVGRGEITQEDFQGIIDRKRRTGDSVPPHGLYLVEIKYDPASFVDAGS